MYFPWIKLFLKCFLHFFSNFQILIRLDLKIYQFKTARPTTKDCDCMEALVEKQPRLGVQMFKKLASLDIMEAQLQAPLKPLQHHGSMISRGLRLAFIMPRGSR